MTSLIPDGTRQKLRWFLKVKPGGSVEDLLTGTEAQGLFVEMLYVDLFLTPCPIPALALLITRQSCDRVS